MTWPLSQDYNEAIQDPRNSFSDAELKTGEAVTNALGIPMPRSGNFADVYEVRCPSGSRWAVKCFTREVFGLQERYSEISKYLRLANLPFMVDFKFLEQGIRVRGQWYPILKMQWVEGFVLNEFVRDNLDKKPILQALGQIWLRMARRLRESYIAHCDLQHGNVMFVPGSTANSLAVKLIDYDGMCVPSLVGTKSGEVGHPAYQHPERLRSGAYNQEVDRFSLLSIATALRCLTIGGRSLWERYDNGDNLLFGQSDLQAPAQSPLFQELMAIGDPQARKLVTELFRACQGPLADVPFLTDLMPEEKPGEKVTKTLSASASGVQRGTGARGPDWDFGAAEPTASVAKKSNKKRGMPVWAWGAIGGAAALMLLSAGVGLGLLFFKGSAEKESTSLARNQPAATSSKRTTKPSKAPQLHPNEGGDNPSESQPVNPPPDDKNKPMNGNIPQGAGDQPPAADIARPKRIFQLAPGGDKLAMSAEGDKTWKLIDPRTNAVIRTFAGHEGAITTVAFSADGQRALTGSEDGSARLWNVASGEMIRMVPGRAPVLALALSADGRRGGIISSRDQRSCQVWDFETGRPHGYGFGRRPTCLAFSADSQAFVAGLDRGDKERDQVMMLWPLVPGGRIRHFHTVSQPVTCVALSPDGKYAASGQSGEARIVTLWDASTAKQLWQSTIPASSLDELAFSPDSRFLLVAAGTIIRLLQVPSGQPVGQLDRPSGIPTYAAFSSDSKQALCASYEEGKIRLRSLVLPASAVVSSPSSATQPAEGWDRPIDPTGDCQFRADKGKLTITIPSNKQYDLSVESGNMNGPRLLRDIEGDFTVEVHVSADFQESYIQAAGLFLMVDPNSYLRLERGRFGKKAVRMWELRRDGKRVPPAAITELSKEEGYLRLERRGNKVSAFVSDDGETWVEQKPFEIDLPRKVKIGVSAISVSGAFATTFDQFKIKQAQGDWVRIDKWLAPAGAVSPPGIAWEPPIDPDHDCNFEKAAGKLTITVPAKVHGLTLKKNDKKSPRLLFDVEGDFTIQVRVSGDFTAAATASDGGRLSWIGAGLLLWVDENTFIRLERAGSYRRQPSTLYANWEVFEDGKYVDTKHNFAGLSTAETYFRLERRGKQLLASYSEDGQTWIKINPQDIELPAKVKIGVLAGSSSGRLFAPTFDQLQIKQGQGEMVDEAWPSLAGKAAVVVKPPKRPRRPGAANRIPVPAEATLADKKKQLQQMYKDDYKKMSQRGLSTYLYEESQRQSDLGLRYVMLLESRDLAARSGDFAAALRAVSRLGQQFAADPLDMKCRAVEQSSAVITSKTDNRELTQKVLLLVDRAVIEERYELADHLLKVARAAAEKADMSALLKQAVEHSTKQLAALRTEYEPVEPAADKLDSNPQDEEASLALGKFRCFTREDWDGGLPLLEHGSDPALRKLARQDLANPADAADRVKLGDGWYEQAAKAMAKEKPAYLKRAYYWYQDAVDDVVDRKDQARVKQQIAKLKTQLPELTRPFADLDYSGPTVSRKSGVPLLHLRPHQVVATRRTFHGPIDIVVTAVLPKGHLRLSFLNGGEMTVDAEKNHFIVCVYSPLGTDAEERGKPSNPSTLRMGPGPVQEIRMQVRANGWNSFINGQRGGGMGWSDRRTIDYMPSPVRVWSDDAEVDIKSIVVKPIR